MEKLERFKRHIEVFTQQIADLKAGVEVPYLTVADIPELEKMLAKRIKQVEELS